MPLASCSSEMQAVHNNHGAELRDRPTGCQPISETHIVLSATVLCGLFLKSPKPNASILVP